MKFGFNWLSIIIIATTLILQSTYIIGLLARFTRKRFGIYHHILYLMSVCGVILCLAIEPDFITLFCLIVLLLLSRTSPKKMTHPIVATLALLLWYLYAIDFIFLQNNITFE